MKTKNKLKTNTEKSLHKDSSKVTGNQRLKRKKVLKTVSTIVTIIATIVTVFAKGDLRIRSKKSIKIETTTVSKSSNSIVDSRIEIHNHYDGKPTIEIRSVEAKIGLLGNFSDSVQSSYGVPWHVYDNCDEVCDVNTEFDWSELSERGCPKKGDFISITYRDYKKIRVVAGTFKDSLNSKRAVIVSDKTFNSLGLAPEIGVSIARIGILERSEIDGRPGVLKCRDSILKY